MVDASADPDLDTTSTRAQVSTLVRRHGGNDGSLVPATQRQSPAPRARRGPDSSAANLPIGAIQGTKAGARVAVVERGAAVGGECVQRGTIPSKTLRETAVGLASFRQRSGNVFDLAMPEGTKISSLLTRLDEVIQSHQTYIGDRLRRNGIDLIHGRARFVAPTEVEVQGVQGTARRLTASTIVIAWCGAHAEPS